MKNYFLPLLLFISLTYSCSCGKSKNDATDTDEDQVSDSNSSSSSKGAGKAKDIIDYYNVFIGFNNSTIDKISNFESNTLPLLKESVAQKSAENIPIMFHDLIGIVRTQEYVDGKSISVDDPGAILPNKIVKEIKPGAVAMVDSYNAVVEQSKDFREYIANEDFLDDDWKKADELLSDMEVEIKKYYENREIVLDVLAPKVEKANEETLKDHPLKKELLLAQKALNLAQEISNEANTEEVDMDKIEELYTELDETQKEASSVNKKKLEEQNKDAAYDNFLERIDEYLGDVRKAKRDGEIDVDEAEDIYDEYGYLINSYNQFVS